MVHGNGNSTSGGPSVVLQHVTPAMAQAWLDRTTVVNRKLKKENVAKFARDIRARRWRVNGETMKLTKDGQLIDGQTRAWAIIEAGLSIETFVARGVEVNTMPTVDTGAPRSFSDVLTMEGRPNAILLAATAAWLARYDAGNLLSMHPISHQELGEIISRNPEIVDSVRVIVAGPKVIPPAALAFVHFMAKQETPQLADDFVYMVQHGVGRDGEGLRQEHPVHRLRERLLMQRGSKSRLARHEVLALTIRAWSLFKSGRTTKSLRWRSVGPAAEPFPTFDIPVKEREYAEVG